MSNPRLLAFPFVEISFAQPNVEMCWASSEISHRAFCPGARQDGLHHTVDANICPFLVGVALGLGEFWVCTESCWRNLHVDSSNKPFQWLRWSSVLENRSDSVTWHGRSVLKEEVGGMGMCLFISAAMNGNEDIQQGDTKHNDLIFPAGDTRSNGVIQIPWRFYLSILYKWLPSSTGWSVLNPKCEQ